MCVWGGDHDRGTRLRARAVTNVMYTTEFWDADTHTQMCGGNKLGSVWCGRGTQWVLSLLCRELRSCVKHKDILVYWSPLMRVLLCVFWDVWYAGTTGAVCTVCLVEGEERFETGICLYLV